MRHGFARSLTAVTLALCLASTAMGAAPDASEAAVVAERVRHAAEDIRSALAETQKTPGAFPAASAVVVYGDAAPLIYVSGTAHAGRSGKVDADSQFYIASQTKSFIGLLAAQLDENGVLPLDATLAQIWPKLALPAPADPARITMADLLSHQENLRTDTLNFLTAYVRAVPAADYPAMLSRYTQAREAGFRYANLGDLVYGAALEARTGRAWQDWLRQEVLQPLGLDAVYSRTSQIPEEHRVWNHRWDGKAWIAHSPKPDALMHAAGGLTASAKAMAVWMRANLQQRSPTGKPSVRSFERAQRPLAVADLSDGEFVCDGYSLGWYSCVYKRQRVLMHPGGYVGTVSATVLIPGIDAGLSLMANSDSAMERLQLELMKAFVGAATGQSGESERLRKAVADYPDRLARTVAARLEAVRKARGEPAWSDWKWVPTSAETERYVGAFRNERLGRLEVTASAGRLQARLGEMHLALTPAKRDVFGASASALDPPEMFRYRADADSLQWNDDVFVRMAPGEAVESSTE